jgi:hypothetical protein
LPPKLIVLVKPDEVLVSDSWNGSAAAPSRLAEHTAPRAREPFWRLVLAGSNAPLLRTAVAVYPAEEARLALVTKLNGSAGLLVVVTGA